jgi:outer membrane protein assembly factor BamB
VAVCLAIVAWARRPEARPAVVESGAANWVIVISLFVAIMAQLLWFAFASGHRRLIRLLPLSTVLAALAVASCALEVAGWSGAMVPSFRLRGSGSPDERLRAPATEPPAARVDLATTTANDFPQFLGPQRNLLVADRGLARDWKARPPRMRWRQPIGAGWSAFAAVNGCAVTMEQRGPNELVTCYAAGTGQLLWSHAIQARHDSLLGGVGPRSTPTIDDGRVYALGATGILRCLDGSTGQPLWVCDLLAMYGITPEQEQKSVAWGRAASPLVVGPMVIVPAGGPPDGRKVSLVALDKVTGKKRWEGGDQQIGYSSPALMELHETQQVVIVNESSVSGHALQSGQQLWRRPWPGSSSTDANTSQAVAVGDNRILVSKGYGGGAELFRVTVDSGQWTTELLWHENVLKTKLTNVVIYQGHAYGLDDGILSCVEVDTGRRRWKRGRYGHGQILLVGDLLLVLAESGELFLVQPTPERHQVLGSIPVLEGVTWNNLCLHGSSLLVRNAQEAACYDLPVESRQTGP